MTWFVDHKTVSIYKGQYKTTVTEVEYVFYVFYQYLRVFLPHLFPPLTTSSDSGSIQGEIPYNPPQIKHTWDVLSEFFFKSHNFKK